MHDILTTSRVRPYVRRTTRQSLASYLGILRARRRYLTAGRDINGAIRLSDGRGLLVAPAATTRAEIQRQRDWATTPKFISHYDAALALLRREEQRAATERAAKRAPTTTECFA